MGKEYYLGLKVASLIDSSTDDDKLAEMFCDWYNNSEYDGFIFPNTPAGLKKLDEADVLSASDVIKSVSRNGDRFGHSVIFVSFKGEVLSFDVGPSMSPPPAEFDSGAFEEFVRCCGNEIYNLLPEDEIYDTFLCWFEDEEGRSMADAECDALNEHTAREVYFADWDELIKTIKE